MHIYLEISPIELNVMYFLRKYIELGYNAPIQWALRVSPLKFLMQHTWEGAIQAQSGCSTHIDFSGI